jgi:exosortase
VNYPVVSPRGPAHEDQGQSTSIPWVLMTVLIGAVVGLYGAVLLGLWSDWLSDDNYAHGVLVPPFVAWLIWRRRLDFQRLERRPSYVGALLVAVGLCLYLLGQVGFEFFVTRVSLLVVLSGVVVQLFGWRHLRLCAFPLLLLALAIPLPALIFNEIALPMQLLASQFGVATLHALDIAAVREGNIILLERATLEVAEACSGIRSLISLGTLALVYGYLGGQSMAARALVVLAVFPVVIVANGLRVASAGAVAHAYGAQAAAGFLHSFSGWLFFGSAVLMLVAVERGAAMLRWPGPPSPPEAMRPA